MRHKSFQKYEEIWLLRRSCSSLDLYVEHFVVRRSIFSSLPTGFTLLDMATKFDWISSLEKKDRSKSSGDWTRGRHNRHCRRRCTYRVYLNEYDSGSMILSIMLHTKTITCFLPSWKNPYFSLDNVLLTSPILTTWDQKVRMQLLKNGFIRQRSWSKT